MQFSRYNQRGTRAALWAQEYFPHPVGLSGLEPPTSRLSGVRSNLLSYKPIPQLSAVRGGCLFGNALIIRPSISLLVTDGDEEIRTLDPLLARQVLSQLSYIPFFVPAPAYSPTSSPMQYHRPPGS